MKRSNFGQGSKTSSASASSRFGLLGDLAMTTKLPHPRKTVVNPATTAHVAQTLTLS